jgi:hypothetical protein
MPKRAPRRRVGTEDELRKVVREVCEREFAERVGKPWDPHFERFGKVSWDLEKEARQVLARLRGALLETVAFTKRQDVRNGWGAAISSIRVLAEQGVARLLKQPALQTGKELGLRHRWEPLREGRAHLVHLLDTYDLFGLTPYEGGPSRFLTLREMTIISLLLGNWPALPRGPLNYTAADVIEEEMKRIRRNRRHMQAGVTDAGRGPKKGKPKDR